MVLEKAVDSIILHWRLGSTRFVRVGRVSGMGTDLAVGRLVLHLYTVAGLSWWALVEEAWHLEWMQVGCCRF